MTNPEDEFRQRWRLEKKLFEAWGRLVCDELYLSVGDVLTDHHIDMFFRIPVKPRIKQEDSLVGKAFHRGKGYKDPYDDIEDKVAMRIVVLSSGDISIVEDVVEKNQTWSYKKARDYALELTDHPFVFDYQSVHYILRANAATQIGEFVVPKGTPCELQIRTLLQHAYSELTHDTIYKPTVAAEPDVMRAAAKSMALIEATDDYFTEVRDKIAQAAAPSHKVNATLVNLYSSLLNEKPDEGPLNSLIVDFYKSWAKDDFDAEIVAFFNEKNYLVERILKRRSNSVVFKQAASLIIYWTISQAQRGAVENSPLSRAELEPFFSDLGIKFPD